MVKPAILLIDNFDSFSFNLVDAFETLGAAVHIYRNTLSAEEALSIAEEIEAVLIVISPGPGAPKDAGCCIELIRQAAGRFPLFGVCLGHQAMVEAFGGEVGPAGAIVHGKKSRLSHGGHGLFAGLPAEISVGRYHSLAARRMPEVLDCVAEAEGLVMALAHKVLPVYGLQFHPESILTSEGQRILANVLALAQQGVLRCR
ncbi:MAG: aminodeoxychorismate/anthranilate synthase component II [Gammaproteobacteria bacterium]|nr:aminodeoxychorismate/anthranilate synthase component II [Gammaproteobacteria bacterium]